MDIVESNKLIAEFMDLELTDGYWRNSYEIMSYFPALEYTRDEQDLHFDNNWRWLMPVIEKITATTFDDGEHVFPRTFGMVSDEGLSMFRFNRHCLFSEETLIEAAYFAVVDFIQNNPK